MTQQEALAILKTGANVFLTGEPGAGKTFTVNAYVDYLRSCGIDPAITASTGIAATHIGGTTIHSWSSIGIRKKLSGKELEIIRENEHAMRRIGPTQVLIIDEISMLDAQTLDTIELILRYMKGNEKPFGGIQVVLVGDFFQLPPVSRNGEPAPVFAFHAEAWKNANIIPCYITEQHRQSDDLFLDLLSALRSGTISDTHRASLEQRKIEDSESLSQETVKLFSHNQNVDYLNDAELAKLPGELFSFEMKGTGRPAALDQLKRGCLSPETLHLRKNASVMFTKNSLSGSYVNGTLGVVTGFALGTNYPIVRTKNGRVLVVEPAEWAVEENGKIRATISQIPLRLAWAMTIHKSQGMSLDAAYMDLSHSFVPGQGYVALSRVRTLDGLHIAGWNEKALKVHDEVLKKDIEFREASDDIEKEIVSRDPDKQKKLEEQFIERIGGKIPEVGAPPRELKKKKEKGDTQRETLRLFREGKTVEEIAELREMVVSTILGHLGKLLDMGDLTYKDISHLGKGYEKEIKEVHKAFAAVGAESLTKVRDHLGEYFSYDILHLARLFWRGEKDVSS